MDIWYARLTEQDLMEAISTVTRGAGTKQESAQAKKGAQQARKTVLKAHTRDSLQALSKLAEVVDGRYQIISQPPVVIPARDLESMYGYSADQLEEMVHQQFLAYRETLQDDRRQLLERFEIVDMARKVVGVGSVGTRAFIVLLQGRDEQDPLFLQVKEATASVLEGHLPQSRFKEPGERVVQGQRLMQAASDIFLGWTKGVEENRHLYWRQLRDMKGSALVETMTPVSHDVLCRHLWLDLGPGPRQVGRCHRIGRVPGQERQVRPVDHRLLRSLCRPERAGLPSIRDRRSGRDSWQPSRTSEVARWSRSALKDARRRHALRSFPLRSASIAGSNSRPAPNE